MGNAPDRGAEMRQCLLREGSATSNSAAPSVLHASTGPPPQRLTSDEMANAMNGAGTAQTASPGGTSNMSRVASTPPLSGVLRIPSASCLHDPDTYFPSRGVERARLSAQVPAKSTSPR